MSNNVQYKHNQLIMEGLRVRNRLVSAGAVLVVAGAISGAVYSHNAEVQRQNDHAAVVRHEERVKAAQLEADRNKAAAEEAAKRATPTPTPRYSPTVTPSRTPAK